VSPKYQRLLTIVTLLDRSLHKTAAQSAPDNNRWAADQHQISLIARTVSMDYLVTFVELLLGLFMLPFNTSHLGQSAYGLWVLAASITFYFSMLNLGYGYALVKYVAQFRAHRDSTGLNQVVSTMFFVFAGIGVVAYALAAIIALNLQTFFNVRPDQVATGRTVLLAISAYIALGFPFSVFGALMNGFQRKYLNGVIGMATSIVVAIVNVVVLLLGYGLVELVIATTAVRILSYFGYRLNAYRVFPALQVSARHVRLSRLKELTGFSAYMLLIDLANKLNYATDTVVIGVFMSTAAVAIWAVAQRLIELTQRLTDQLNGALFPVVVDSATLGNVDRLKVVLLQGTRLSLAMVLPIATGLALLAESVVLLWVGPQFSESVPIIHILAAVVTFRVGNATATTLLKGAGHHRLLAVSNLVIGITNLALSVLFVGTYGLQGVALGTLIPLSLVSILVLFPAACRRAGVPVGKAFASGVWPAIWPAIFMAGFLSLSRKFLAPGFVSTAVQAVSAGLIYAVLFLALAIGSTERNWYLAKIRQVIGLQGMPAA
jgi:O-antigen/teichoic acid export membrane protein